MSAPHKFVYFGTPSVAGDTLVTLLVQGFTPALVVTSPDAPRGRGLVLTPCPTKVIAREHHLPVLTPEKLDDKAIAAIAAYGADYGVCVAYGKIFPEELIALFPRGVLNVHYSLLPKYRGATPLETALRRGETVTGVTIQKMAKELDAGDLVTQESTSIGPEETACELRPRLVELGARLLIETLPLFERDEIVAKPQDAALATRAYKLKKKDGCLSLTAPAQDNWNTYRAYADSIGTYFMHDGKRVKITSAALRNGMFTIERVIPEGKREMSYAQFETASTSRNEASA